MEIINNRYRIVKCIKQNRVVSSYVVNDIIKNYDTIQLNIINSEYLKRELVEFYTKEFISLTNLACKNITSVYDFDLVNLLDNKKLNDKVYFYTNEYMKSDCSILDIVEGMESEEILNLFIEICQSINYLHLKAFIYGDINLSNIKAESTGHNKKYCIKFKDFATIELERQGFWKEQNNEDYFKAPEILEGQKCSSLSDIYSLGILLLIIYVKSKDPNFVINDEVKHFNACKLQEMLSNGEIFNNNEDSNINFKKIIEKMTYSDAEKRYGSISELVMDINIFFNKQYVPYRNEEIEKLNFKFKMIGRDEEVNKIVNIYEAIKNKNNYNSTILIHGESGIGKTRVLKELKHLFSLNKVNTYSSFVLDASNKNSNKAFLDILKQFISESESEVIERYQSELVKFIPELHCKKSIIPSEPLNGDREKFRLINRANGFIEECINNKPTIIIIDNFHLADDFTIELTEYLIRKKLPNKNIMVIMSYCDGECVLNKKFTEFIKNIAINNVVTNIFLSELSEVQVGMMIQNILSMRKIPFKFADSIYEKTCGNPLFVQEVIKSFFNKKYIYIDKKEGYWTKDYEYSKFIIPPDMHGVLLNQIKEMGQVNYNILKIISIFNSAVSLEIIKSFIQDHSNDLQKSIEGLISSGILCKKIEDRGFVFGFYNKFLKSLMYERISDEDRKDMHRLASVVLENQYTEGEYIEELIYHLEKSNQRGKIIDYCMENAEKMKLLKNRSDAIKNLTKASSILDYAWEPVKNIKLIMDLASLHEQEGHIDLAVKYYLSVQKYKENKELYKYIIDSLIKVAKVYLSKNNIQSTIYYVEKIQTMLESVNYVSGMLKCQGILASVYDKRQEYESVQTICNRCLDLCIGEYEELKTIFYNHKGLAYLRSGREREALVIFEKNIEVCNKYNNVKGLIKSLNRIGVIYGDYYQDDNKAIKYFLEVKELCEKNNMSSDEVLALINIGATYFSKEQYEISLKYFMETLEICKKYQDEFHVFYCYSSISGSYLKLGDYDNAYKYYEICNKELEKYPNQGKEIGEFYFSAAELNYKLGDLKKAEDYIHQALDIYDNDESIFKWQAQILHEYIRFHFRENDENLSENIKAIITIASKISSLSSRLNIFYDVIIFLYESGKQEYIPTILSEIKKIDFQIDIKGNRVYVKKLYVEGLLEKKKSIKSFNEALEYSNKYKEVDTYWKIYTAMGDYYFEKKDYLYSVIYYFEACGILKDIIHKLPSEYRLAYIKHNNALKPFNKFLVINNYYKNNKDIAVLEYEEVKVKDEAGLLGLLQQVNHKEILKNKNFIKSIKKIYSSSLHEDIHDINDLLENLQSDNAKNLELIIDYLSCITLATRGTIIILDNAKEYKVIASSDRRYDLPQTQEVLSKILIGERAVLVTGPCQEQNIKGDEVCLNNNLKASIYIPIIMENINEKDFSKNERRKNTNGNNHVIAYVYIESKRELNNLNKDSMKKCMELSKVIGIIIEKYKFRLSASIDKLTGTLTRKYLEVALGEQIEISSQTGSEFSLIMYDLDHFKIINDKFGHRTGDFVLKRVCDVVLSNLRETDIVGRYGGEEFIVILPGTGVEEAELVAEKLRSKIEGEKILDNRRDVTVSLGVATFPLHSEWKDELVERVDQALYVAKQQGRNRYDIWNNEFSKKAKRTDRLTGIISGNILQDHRNVLAMIELIEIININTNRVDKIYSLLGRIIEITEARKGVLFILENDNIVHKFSREIFKNEWVDIDTYNGKIVESVIHNKQGVYKIDWDTISEYDSVTGVPNWQSVIAIPLIQGETVKGVLYLTESTQAKEFGFEDFNFVNTLGKIIVPIL